MRVLHAAFANLPSPGIVKQMHWEMLSVADGRLDWSVFLYCAKVSRVSEGYGFIELYTPGSAIERSVKLLYWLRFRWMYYKRLGQLSKDFDAVLLRYSPYDILQALYVLRSVKPVYLVHHTLEVNELEDGRGVRGWVLARLEELIGRLALRRACGLIGVTEEIADYESQRAGGGRKTFVYPNGMMVEVAEVEDQRGDVPELLFVASSFVPWHGLDLIVDEFRRLESSFRLHLVGHIPAGLQERIGDDSRFVCHGVLDAEGIARLTRVCWVGLSSFALFRKGMREACTLKVREYLASGLPVYSGHADVFPADFPFYRRGEANAEAILDYARECRAVHRADVVEAAMPFIDKRRLVARLFGEIETDLRSRVRCET